MPTPDIAQTNGDSTGAAQNNNTRRGEKVEIDRHGDMCLIAGSTKTIFLVSFKTLCLASRVWEAMLSPSSGFQESKSDNIPLPDDNAEALRIILLIAHLRHRDLPKERSLDDLYELAMLCDKYDTVSMVEPCITRWINPEKPIFDEPGNEKWLSIAWIFGYGQMFVRQVDYLVLNLISDEYDMNGTDRNTLDDITPAGIIDSIRVVRRHIVTELLNTCYGYIHSFPRCKQKADPINDPDGCDAMACGSFILGLKSCNLWPNYADAITVNYSVEQLWNLLRSIKIQGTKYTSHSCASTLSYEYRAKIDKPYKSANLRYSYKLHPFFNGVGRFLKDPGGVKPEVLSKLGLSADDFELNVSGSEDKSNFRKRARTSRG